MLDRVYGILLRALPRSYDDRDRVEMWATYQSRVERASELGGRAALRERTGELIDLLATLVAAFWPFPSWESLLQDLKIGLRSLLRSPLASSLAVLSLALGIGATSSMFSALDVWLIRPLPLPNEASLVDVGMANRERGWTRNAFSIRDYVDWAEASETVDLMVYANTFYNLATDGSAEHVLALQASANALEVLGIEPVLGRGFAPEEGTPAGDRVTVLTDAFWRSAFGADPDIIGETIQLDGRPVTVIGVLPAGQGIPTQRAELWMPLRISGDEERGGHFLWAIGRLREGVGLDAARAELGAVAQQVAEQDPERTFPHASVRPLREQIYGVEYDQGGLVMGVAALFVLLIACANIANILLARGLARTQELAVRGALGAGRSRIVQQLLVESFIIAVAGGLLGLGVAYVGIDLMLTYVLPAEYVTGWDAISLNLRVVGAAAVMALSSVFIFGLIPALRVSRHDLREQLSSGGAGGSIGGKNRLPSALVVGEISATLFLVVLSSLLIRSLIAARSVDMGMRTTDALVYRLDVPSTSSAADMGLPEFYGLVAERLEASSEVTGVTTSTGHIMQLWSTYLYSVPSLQGVDPEDRRSAEHRRVTESYLEVMDLQMLAGRWFDAGDREESLPVAVVSRRLASQWWEDPADALGHQLSYGEDGPTIVGVVEAGYLRGPANLPPAAIFVPFAQQPGGSTFNVLAHETTTEAAVQMVRGVVRDIDPGLAVFGAESIEAAYVDSFGPQLAAFRLLGAFGGLALGLTLVGVYGVIAHNVGRRLPEMGLRLALGADGGGLVRMIVAANAKIAVIGLGIGLGLALAGGQGMRFILFGVSPYDPVVFATASVCLCLAILAASYIPARRAAMVDPVQTLRRE